MLERLPVGRQEAIASSCHCEEGNDEAIFFVRYYEKMEISKSTNKNVGAIHESPLHSKWIPDVLRLPE